MSDKQVLTLAERRKRFRTNWAQGLAEKAAGGPVCGFTRREAHMGLSGRLCWFSAPGRLVVVAGPYQGRRDVDLALAFGLHHVKHDEDLVLVIPSEEAVSRATLVRAPWIDRPLEVWTYDLAGLERGEVSNTEPERPPLDSRQRVFEKYTGADGWGYGTTPTPPRDYRIVLGDQAAWVEELVSWLLHRDLDAEHRKTYAAWKCAGKIVLKIQRSRGKLTLTAGIQYSNPERSPVKVICSGALSEEDLVKLKAGVSGAVTEMLDGMGGRYPEHRLQATIARQEPPILGLASNPVAEYAAWRPYERPRGRAFLDFLGVDEKGTLHVLETKVGGDVMLMLQGLDYWIWATANWNALTEEFDLGDRPKVEVDFLVSEKGADNLLGPYSKAQSKALAPEVVHRFWEISNWEQGGAPVIRPLDFE